MADILCSRCQLWTDPAKMTGAMCFACFQSEDLKSVQLSTAELEEAQQYSERPQGSAGAKFYVDGKRVGESVPFWKTEEELAAIRKAGVPNPEDVQRRYDSLPGISDPAPHVTDRIQGTDCPECEDGEPHTHGPIVPAKRSHPLFTYGSANPGDVPPGAELVKPPPMPLAAAAARTLLGTNFPGTDYRITEYKIETTPESGGGIGKASMVLVVCDSEIRTHMIRILGSFPVWLPSAKVWRGTRRESADHREPIHHPYFPWLRATKITKVEGGEVTPIDNPSPAIEGVREPYLVTVEFE